MEYQLKGTAPSYTDLIDMYKPTVTTTFACLVYGPSGSGKTTFAGTFPDPFFIDADRGMRSLQGEFPRYQLQKATRPFTAVLNIMQDAVAKRGPWAEGGPLASRKTIVIDSITSLIDDYLMPEAMLEAKRDILNDKPSYDEYGKIKSRMTALASVLKDLALTRYVVFTALVEEEKDENSGELIGKPMMTGKYRDKAMADFDETYYFQTQPQLQGPQKYLLHAQTYKWYRAKSRLTTIKSLENPSFAKLLESFKATKP